MVVKENRFNEYLTQGWLRVDFDLFQKWLTTSISTDASCQIQVLWHDRNTFWVNGAQICIFKKIDHEGLGAILQKLGIITCTLMLCNDSPELLRVLRQCNAFLQFSLCRQWFRVWGGESELVEWSASIGFGRSEFPSEPWRLKINKNKQFHKS